MVSALSEFNLEAKIKAKQAIYISPNSGILTKELCLEDKLHWIKIPHYYV
jgi:hypothetical protein